MGKIHTAITAAQKQFEKDMAAAEQKLADATEAQLKEFYEKVGLWHRGINNDYWVDLHPEDHIYCAGLIEYLDPELENLLSESVINHLCLGSFVNRVDPDPAKYEWVQLEGESLTSEDEKAGKRRRLKIVSPTQPQPPGTFRFTRMTRQVAKIVINLWKRDPVKAGELLTLLPVTET